MTITTYLLGLISTLFALYVVIEMLRRRRLRERHAIWWFIAGVLALIVGIFPTTLVWAADLVGVAVPTNLVFFVTIAILFFVCLQHSSELTTLEAKTRTLAERSALLELRVLQLETLSQAPAAHAPAIDAEHQAFTVTGLSEKV